MVSNYRSIKYIISIYGYKVTHFIKVKIAHKKLKGPMISFLQIFFLIKVKYIINMFLVYVFFSDFSFLTCEYCIPQASLQVIFQYTLPFDSLQLLSK